MDIPVLLILAATLGAILNVVRGLGNAPKDPNTGKIIVDPLQVIGAIILAVMASYATVQATDLTNLAGPIATLLAGLLIGFGTDFGITKLKNGGS